MYLNEMSNCVITLLIYLNLHSKTTNQSFRYLDLYVKTCDLFEKDVTVQVSDELSFFIYYINRLYNTPCVMK